jgi:hypothetical protein
MKSKYVDPRNPTIEGKQFNKDSKVTQSPNVRLKIFAMELKGTVSPDF